MPLRRQALLVSLAFIAEKGDDVRISTLLIALLVAGCAASGVKVTDEQMKHFKPGETTLEQVVAVLGKPTNKTRMSDGTTSLMYVFAESKVRPETFIPFVGGFIGGADTSSNVAMLRFDGAGKLMETSSSTSEMGTGMGFSAGQVAPLQTEQPRR